MPDETGATMMGAQDPIGGSGRSPAGIGPEARREEAPVAGQVAGIAAFGLALAAGALIRTGETGAVAGGVLLGIAALALGAVALGGRPYGPEAEGRLDLSTRLGLGLLGGLLGAVAALAGQWALSALGVPARLGVDLPALDGTAAGARLLYGSGLGLVLGVSLPWVPGPGIVARGAAFSLAVSAYVLFVAYPARADFGLLGLERGPLTFVFVLLLNAVWGMVAAWTVGWGARSEGGAVSAPLGA